MLFLLVSCLGGPIVEWANPSGVMMTGMLGMHGEQIAWGQLEIDAGRKNGKDCVALLSLKMVKLRNDCPTCVSASEMRFTNEISNTIPNECLGLLGGVQKTDGKRWSLGYDKKGQILAHRGGQWKVISPQSEKQMDMRIFQVQ